MATPVIMPRQGQSVETCIIAEWQKKVGDTVKSGDILYSYETDKAAFEAEAEADGVLIAVFYDEGDEVAVLTNVAVIGQEGENFNEYIPVSEEKKVIEEQDISIQSSAPKEEINPAVVTNYNTSPTDVKISPRAKKLAEKLGVQYSHILGSGPENRIIEKDIEAFAKDTPLMTSLAKAIAEEQNYGMVNSGNGMGGRITGADMLSAPSSDDTDFELKKISNIRKIIAENMLNSLGNSAQLTHHTSAKATRLLDYRKRVKEDMQKGSSANITLNDMICFAVIKALKKHPEINCHFLGNAIKTFNKIHLAIAVDTERGLMVPALRDVGDLSIEELSKNLKSLAESCQKGSVDPGLLPSTAASFTISNLGSFGVEMFTPVLNLPQAGILGINTIIQRPEMNEDGKMIMAPYIGLSLTYDHRALDGAPASRFLQQIKEEIERI